MQCSCSGRGTQNALWVIWSALIHCPGFSRNNVYILLCFGQELVTYLQQSPVNVSSKVIPFFLFIWGRNNCKWCKLSRYLLLLKYRDTLVLLCFHPSNQFMPDLYIVDTEHKINVKAQWSVWNPEETGWCLQVQNTLVLRSFDTYLCFQMRKLEFRKVKELIQDHTTSQWLCKDSGSVPELLTAAMALSLDNHLSFSVFLILNYNENKNI